MSKINWTSFTRKININASKNSILNAWLSQDEIEKWFLSNAQFFDGDKLVDRYSKIAKGNTYKWSWHTSDVLAEGEVIDVGEDELTFTFVGCSVKVSVSAAGGENILELTQSNISTDEETKMGTYLECTRGWTFYMTNLKSVLEGGLDLRNKNDKLKDMLST